MNRDEIVLWFTRFIMLLFFITSVVGLLTGCTTQTRQKTQEQTQTREISTTTITTQTPETTQTQTIQTQKTIQTETTTSTLQQTHQILEPPIPPISIPSDPTKSFLFDFISTYLFEGLAGLGAAIFGWRWFVARYQRDQLITSVEHARRVLPPEIDRQFTTQLATRQDQTVQQVVQQKTQSRKI